LATSYLLLQPVGPKGGGPPTTATTGAPDAGASGGNAQQPPAQSMLIMLIPMALVAFMLFTNRSQRQKEAEVRSKLKKGDRVVSQAGLIGELVEFDDKVAKVKIAPGTTVQMLMTSISPFDPVAGSTPAASDKKLSDLKDAKAAAEKKG
jgi:preprotein translocase subunit YajC